jgi:hypothetical protein
MDITAVGKASYAWQVKSCSSQACQRLALLHFYTSGLALAYGKFEN